MSEVVSFFAKHITITKTSSDSLQRLKVNAGILESIILDTAGYNGISDHLNKNQCELHH